MRQTFKCLIAVMAMLFVGVTAYAQVTTSSLNGIVSEKGSGETLFGATIVAVHTPSGTKYVAMANEEGRFVINGMRTGGPYTVEISYIGMKTMEFTDIILNLGEPYEITAEMEGSELLDAVVVISEKSFIGSKTGAGAHFDHASVESMPTIDRSIYDVVKFTPQASMNKSGGISFAGSNNRYNSFQIDGAIANDSFGLAASGTNGGQTGANPISLDAIEEIQVVIAPYDVRQSGFTGGAMNAITKSGTNQIKGSAYAYYFDQNLVGTTPGKLEEGKTRSKYSSELSETFGFTLGGPIVKDKLFFFISGEFYKKNYPNVYNPADGSYDNSFLNNSAPLRYNGKEIGSVYDSNPAVIPVTVNGTPVNSQITSNPWLGSVFNAEVAQAILDKYQKDYAPASNFSESFTQHNVATRSVNVLARLDWNINDRHKLMFRYQFMDAYKDQYGSGSTSYYFNNSSFKMADRTNTFVLELNSRFSDIVSNELRVTGVMVRDHRDYPYQGANIYVNSDKVGFNLGTEYSSGANAMNSDTYTLTDNVNVFLGNHNLTFGTHNELFKFSNVFRQYAFGEYNYKTVEDFFNNNIYKYYYNYADPTITGSDDTLNWAATTYAAQFGLYAQDEWKPNRNFTLTYGIRADLPVLLNKPTANDTFNSFAENTLKSEERVGVIPKAQVLFSPRVGFRLYLDDAHKSLLRGGAGLFTGRVPFVWLSNAYNNTGVETKSATLTLNGSDYNGKPFPLTSNPYKDIIQSGLVTASAAGATINTLSKNFKYPQVFRVNLGFDQEFADGWKLTFDALYSKTLNNVFFKNLAIVDNGKKVYGVSSAVPESAAPYYSLVDKAYTTIVALDNTNVGYSYSLSAKIEKAFDFGLNVMAAYTFGHSYSVNDGTSSVAYSNWKYNYSVDTNAEEFGYALFDKPHKVNVVLSYNSPKYAGGRLATNVSLTYLGESGQRYAYTMNEGTDFNGDQYTGNSLMYIPTTEQIGLMNWATAGDAGKFENYIRTDKYLSSHRGQWSTRYGGIAPFEHHFDLHIGEDFYYDKANGRKIQIFADFLNISNLFNREWGLYYGGAYNLKVLQVPSLTADAQGNMTPVYKYNPDKLSISDFNSRWRCQLGVRVTF